MEGCVVIFQSILRGSIQRAHVVCIRPDICHIVCKKGEDFLVSSHNLRQRHMLLSRGRFKREVSQQAFNIQFMRSKTDQVGEIVRNASPPETGGQVVSG